MIDVVRNIGLMERSEVRGCEGMCAACVAHAVDCAVPSVASSARYRLTGPPSQPAWREERYDHLWEAVRKDLELIDR